MFEGIRIMERMVKIFNEQGDNAVYSIAEWIEELQDKYSASSKENCELRREAEAQERQVKRLIANRDRLQAQVDIVEATFARRLSDED